MSFSAGDWAEVYRPLIGQQLEALIWMPMSSDTPGVAAQLECATLSFAGAVFLVLGQRKLFLTWRQSGINMALAEGLENAWLPHALDRIHSSYEDPWAPFIGGSLERIQFFAAPHIDGDRVNALRHTFMHNGEAHVLWIATGQETYVGDVDELWVSSGPDPDNLEQLIEVGGVA